MSCWQAFTPCKALDIKKLAQYITRHLNRDREWINHVVKIMNHDSQIELRNYVAIKTIVKLLLDFMSFKRIKTQQFAHKINNSLLNMWFTWIFKWTMYSI